MTVEIKVPTLPESVADAVIAKWYKKVGDSVQRDENIVDLETDKVMLEVPALASGIIKEINFEEGAEVTADQILAVIEEGEVSATPEAEAKDETKDDAKAESTKAASAGPSARRAAKESDVDVNAIAGSGKGGRVTKTDVQKPAASTITPGVTVGLAQGRHDERVPMSRIRQRIAERLVEVQQTAALLTTFNEINMQPVMNLRKKYKDQFEKVHGVRLGFMSFFVKAVVEALKQFPAVNASIDGKELIYHNYFDIGVAIGSPRGLVVPIVRDAEQLAMADIEKKIIEYKNAAQTGKITMDDMTGGTFTITNGGAFGSLMSTPIINAPQAGILGMHAIKERAVVEDGEVVARPMMYVALSYDHRIIDGRESVQFLVVLKELLEDPARMILGL